MGLDAHLLNRNLSRVRCKPLRNGGYRLENRALSIRFIRVAREVARGHGGVDAELLHGGLGVSEAVFALRDAVYGAVGLRLNSEAWSPAFVREAVAAVKWPKRLNWAQASARALLITAAENGKGIGFQ